MRLVTCKRRPFHYGFSSSLWPVLRRREMIFWIYGKFPFTLYNDTRYNNASCKVMIYKQRCFITHSNKSQMELNAGNPFRDCEIVSANGSISKAAPMREKYVSFESITQGLIRWCVHSTALWVRSPRSIISNSTKWTKIVISLLRRKFSGWNQILSIKLHVILSPQPYKVISVFAVCDRMKMNEERGTVKSFVDTMILLLLLLCCVVRSVADIELA